MATYNLTQAELDALMAQQPITFAVTIQPPATPSIPPIPNLDVWQSLILSLAAKWQEQAMTLQPSYIDSDGKLVVIDFGSGGQNKVWYYDGGRVYIQVAQYTGDQSWLVPARAILDAYATSNIANITASYGGMKCGSYGPAYQAFTKGFMLDFLLTEADARWQSILQLTTSPGIAFMTTAQGQKPWQYISDLSEDYNPTYIREAAYCCKALVCREMIDGIRDPRLEEGLMHGVVADLNLFMTPGSPTYNGAGVAGVSCINNFMIGLALETLILYYEMTASQGTPDERIPPIVKSVLDFFWANCVDHATNITWYNSTSGRYDSNLGLMTAPAFAWYWNFSRDDTYLTQGDLLFGAGITGNELQDTGKQFSANFAWSFDYVKYRQG